jgi:hypothetical protein
VPVRPRPCRQATSTRSCSLRAHTSRSAPIAVVRSVGNQKSGHRSHRWSHRTDVGWRRPRYNPNSGRGASSIVCRSGRPRTSRPEESSNTPVPFGSHVAPVSTNSRDRPTGQTAIQKRTHNRHRCRHLARSPGRVGNSTGPSSETRVSSGVFARFHRLLDRVSPACHSGIADRFTGSQRALTFATCPLPNRIEMSSSVG